MDAPPSLRVEVLGPLRVAVDGVPVDVRGPKQRAILALLALAEGRPVGVSHLVDALWPADDPASARQALHAQVSRLRGRLGPAAARLRTQQDGYRLDLGPADLDVVEARALLTAARADPPGLDALQRAHALWRGQVLADVAPIAVAVEACARLHREVTDALVGAAVVAGRAEEVLGLAARSVADDPLREPVVLAWMRALAATGQAPEALRVGREFRRRLAEETGLGPSPALDRLERDVAGGAGGPAPVRRPVPPRPVTRLVGRDADVAALHRLLVTERLVTVAGPGGVGKTRLALEVAGRVEAEAVVLLAPVTEPAALPHALAGALAVEVVRGDVLAACVAVLADRAGVLVLDNAEHLLDPVRDLVGVLLSGCPGLRVLVTSREPLGLAEERVVRLAPLALPGPSGAPSAGPAPPAPGPPAPGPSVLPGEPAADARLVDVPAVAVFLERAARVRPGPAPTPDELATVADIVRRLDGMPLAIELAAGRLSTFSLTDLADRLDRSLDLLGGRTSADARHRTLRATVEWSYRLLSDDERRLFRHLSVFPDGVDLATAESVAAALRPAGDPGAVLARLVDASMIDAVPDGAGTRYRMLETLRAFGVDRLVAAGEQDAARDRLVRWAVELTGWVDAAVATEREASGNVRLRRELANLRAGWRLARDLGRLDDAAAMVVALFDVVFNRDLVEVRGWAAELAGDPGLVGHPRAAAVLGTAAYAAYARGDHPGAERLGRAGLAAGGDGSAYCRHALAVAALARGAYAESVGHCLDGPPDTRHGFHGLAALATAYAGDLERARRLNGLWAAEAASPSGQAWAAYYAGEIENLAGQPEAAERCYTRAVELGRGVGATFVTGVATVGLLSVRAAAGRATAALTGYREVIDYFARTGNWTHLWATLRNLADLLRRLGDPEPAGVIDDAAARAPDAPALGDRPAAHTGPRGPDGVPPGRAAVLDLARRAIDRNLNRPGRP